MNLSKFLRGTLLFKNVDSEILDQLTATLTPVEIAANQTLIGQGDVGDSLFMLQEGKLEIYLQEQAGQETLVSTLLPGDSVGEIALMTGAIRSATVKAAEPSLLWLLTRDAFEHISAGNPSLRSAVEAAMVERLQRAQLRSALYENRLFEGLDAAILPDLEQALDLVSLPSGETLFQAGDASDAFYIVIRGCLRVGAASGPAASDRAVLSKDIGSGQIVGELGVLTGEPRTATILAVRETLLGRLDTDAFYRLLQKHPKTLLQLSSARIATDYSKKPVKAEDRRNSLRTIALFAIGGVGGQYIDVPLAAFAKQLTEMLGQYGSALHIDSILTDDTLTNQTLGQSNIAHAPRSSAVDSRLALWFGAQEANYDYLVYSSNAGSRQTANLANSLPAAVDPATAYPWAERCAQHADHILYVAWADSEPQAITIAPESRTRRSLVLLHPADRPIPTGTERWLDAIQPQWHFHIRWHGDAQASKNRVVNGDMQRLARLLTGRGVGLVLSGGAARGYAHVGVIRALEEAGIPIDLVGGTSMGAAVAGLWAIGHDADSMTATLIEHLSQRKQIIDFTLPLTSFLAGKKLETLMRTFFDGIDIVDTWRGFFCISTDITRGAEVVHRRGPIWKYVRGSMSLPVAFPPQVDGDNLLIDGCFMNNYPANIMHNTYGCGTVIGVNVSRMGNLRDKNQYGNSLSGWAILNSKLNPFAEPVNAPGLFTTLNRLTDLNTSERSEEQRQQTDLYIRPAIEAYEAADFEKYQEIIGAGYTAARPMIDEWLAYYNKPENR